MTCVHLKKLYQLCQDNDLRLGSTDLVHIVCNQCGVQEVCPSVYTAEYDQTHQADSGPNATSPDATAKPQ